MDEGRQSERPIGRPRLIKRPRLTNLLDDSKARVILLVAPAGYGKTTLAREWLTGRRSGWYTAEHTVSRDIAALSMGLTRAASLVVPGVDTTLLERLRMPDFPELSVDMLAELVATELREWPSDSWLFVDDYHHLSDSRASERFLQVLIREAPITCLIATRRRPAWATARLLMHGDVAEIGRTELAMTKKEAAALLASRQEEDAARILDVADGWPAVLGLAARSPALGPPDTADLPTSVYEYVAEEVYNNFTLPTRRGLCLLTIGAYVTEELAATLLGSEARTVVSSAADAGVLSAEPSGTIDMHPLVVTFLRSKLLRFPKDGLATPIDKVVGYYLEHSRWDDAFDVVARLGDAGLFASVLEGAMDDLLSKGRHATLARWLAFAQREGFDLPVTDLARAEVALRTGELGEAEAFATRAAQRFGTGHPRCSQALLRAGQAAHLADRYEQAVAHHRSARQTAATPSASSSATWGEFVASAQLESQNLSELLNAVIELDDGSADSMIQIANGRYMLACRIGGLREAIEGAIRVRAALAQASDPMTRSSYRNCLGRAYALMARYREAAAVASEQLEEAEAYRMRFIRPNALCTLAIAQMGLRQFGAARATLAVAFAEAEERKDLHNLIDLAAVETRLHVSAGRTDPRPVFPDKAWGRFPGRAVYAEFLASQGLLHTYLDELDRAQDLAEQALRLSDSIEPLGLAHGVQAVVAAKQGRGAAETERALSTARRTGNHDAFIAIYRAYPPLLSLVSSSELTAFMRQTLAQGSDHEIARTRGIEISTRPTSGVAGLSRREREVLALLVEGKTNREIACALFISEVTAKVHVRHICQKLGVRSRVEAAVQGAYDVTLR